MVSVALLESFLMLVSALFVAMAVMAVASRYVPAVRRLIAHSQTGTADGARRATGFPYVPKRYFAWFYRIAIVHWIVLLTTLQHSKLPFRIPAPVKILVTVHFCRRNYECSYLHQWRQQSKMHVFILLGGIGYYVLLPFIFVVRDDVADRTPPALALVGSLLNVYGQYQQYRHHAILADLRTGKSQARYTLPTQGWFRFLTAPHYFAEILLYMGIFLMLPVSAKDCFLIQIRPYGMMAWVVSNLSVSAIQTKQWYVHRYRHDDKAHQFVRTRRAIVPGVL